MIPSQRIGELYIEICEEQGDDPRAVSSMPLYIMAIKKYLDEQYEKEHENHNINDCVECRNFR